MDESRHAIVPTALGELTLTAEGDALTGLFFPEHSHPPTPAQLGDQVESAADPLFPRTLAQLEEYLAG